MHKGVSDFIEHKVVPFYEGIYHLLLFFPYFFSVVPLLKTLFAPWKGLTDQSTKRGFDFSDMLNVMMFNIISVVIGFTIRVFVIIFFVIFQVIYILSIPALVFIFVMCLPFRFLFYMVSKTELQVKREEEERFIKGHTLKEENIQYVKNWFEYDYAERKKKAQWWTLENLFTITPLGRDWAAGYTPTLDLYTTELTGSAYQNARAHLVGRDDEIKKIELALLKSEEANVVMVGEEGVGKHAIIDSFARKIYQGTCNPLLAYKRVLKLQMDKILSKYQDAKEREQFFHELLKEAIKSRNVILVIDNFDKYVTNGQEDRVDLSDPIEEYARTNKLQVIGITTPFAYDKFIFFNEKIKMIFTKVDVTEITKQEALQVLMETNHMMESRYRLNIPFETLQTVIEKSDFFITTIPFPEKAVQLLDNACVYTNETLKQHAVLPETIDTVLTEKTHTPTTLTEDMKEKLLHLETDLSTRVVDQQEAVHELAAAMRRSFLLLGKRKKPLASFLFLGPTGVGKTETAKSIAETFFGNEKTIMRFDMSLYQSKEDIPKLIGSVELQDPGLLSNTIREQPYGVLLLDEIEKADRSLINIFLTILDEGYFTDGFGKRVDCKNIVVIATSNAGADFIYEKLKVKGATIKSNELIAHLIEAKIYSPEFLNRFDGVIAFNPIQSKSMLPIARKMLAAIEQQIFELYKVKVEVSDETLQAVLDKGFDPAFGARNLDRVLRNEIEDQVAQLLLANKVQPGSTIKM